MKKLFPFMRFRYLAFAFSLSLVIVFLLSTIFLRGGINWGIDFAGGVKLTAQFAAGTSINDIRTGLQDEGISASVQEIGAETQNEYIITTRLLDLNNDAKKSSDLLWSVVKEKFPAAEQLGLETVGPAIGDYLKRAAIKLGILAMIMMMVYLAFRFEMKYSFGAMIALVHDVLLAFLFCGIMSIEINIPVIAAFLTIFGYSVNDTIVIFDRIRENSEGKDTLMSNETFDSAINQTISRTLLTSLTTLFSVLALFFIGGEGIRDFAQVMIFGVVIGTYSSIFVASPFVLMWGKHFHAKAK